MAKISPLMIPTQPRRIGSIQIAVVPKAARPAHVARTVAKFLKLGGRVTSCLNSNSNPGITVSYDRYGNATQIANAFHFGAMLISRASLLSEQRYLSGVRRYVAALTPGCPDHGQHV
jgi:hypothetical protein